MIRGCIMLVADSVINGHLLPDLMLPEKKYQGLWEHEVLQVIGQTSATTAYMYLRVLRTMGAVSLFKFIHITTF